MEELKFGKTSDTNIIDANGSTVKEGMNYVEGTVVYPIRRDYEVRHPFSKKTDRCLDDHCKMDVGGLTKALRTDPNRLDPYIKIDDRKSSSDKYYVVECYTKLVY